MKTYLSLFLSLLFCTFLWAKEGVIIDKKTYSKLYSVKPNTTVGLQTSYGNVKIETWSGNKVSFYAEVIVDGKNNAAVQKKLNSISVVFINKNNTVSAQTKIKNVYTKNVNVKVNYVIKIPKNNPLNLLLNYVDLQLPSLNSEVDFTGNYCNIVGSGFINKLSYNGDYNEVKNISSAVCNLLGSYNTFNLNSISNLKFDGNYSDIDIKQLKQNAYFTANYSELKVLSTSISVQNIQISGSYNHSKIKANAQTNVTGKGNYLSVKTPPDYSIIKNYNKKNRLDYSAQNSNNANTIINISGNYSDLTIQ